MVFEDKCACCGSNLDRFLQPIILSILTAGPLTGYAIVKRIADYSTFKGNGPDPTGVYRYLKIMAAKGMLQRVEGEDGKDLYALGPDGPACLERWLGTLEEYAQQVDTLRTELAGSLAAARG